MDRKNKLLILVIFLAVMSTSAQTHNVRRGSDSSTNKPNTSTTTKRTATPPTNRKTSSSNSKKQSSTTTSQNKNQQSISSSPAPHNPIIQNLINNMVYVEGGTFMMGATSEQGVDGDRDRYEKPTHQVTLSSFYICRFEVTQEEWETVMGVNPSKFKGDKRPVENVSWDDCQAFIRKLNAMTGKKFRLPTEAEWEFAARGGNNSQGYKFSGSNDIGLVAWYEQNSGKETHIVGLKQANELGLYDMSSNVSEWCCDWFGKYTSSMQTNPKGLVSGYERVIRGGCWYLDTWYSRISHRAYAEPNHRRFDLGLRLAL